MKSILEHLVTTYGYKNYLEIGYSRHYINCLNTFSISEPSDIPKGQMFDLVYIEHNHQEIQADKDISIALSHLSPNGTIVINNCIPKNEWHTRSYTDFLKYPGEWTGGIWKSIIKLRNKMNICVVDYEWGVGIIRRGASENYTPINVELTFANFQKYKKEWLNTITIDEFFEKYSISKYRFSREHVESRKKEVFDFGEQLKLQAKQKLDSFSDMIRNNENFALVKFHDGEWLTMTTNGNEMNSFGYNYSRQIGDDLIRSYIFLLCYSRGYIHYWHYTPHKIMLDLVDDFLPSNDKFIYCEATVQKLPFIAGQVEFFKSIQQSSRTKIYVSNIHMTEVLQPILNINHLVVTNHINFYASDNLFYPEKERILAQIKELLCNHENAIVLFSAGLGAKIMITDLVKTHPHNTYLDIGSTFDGLLYASRDYNAVPEYRSTLLSTYSVKKNENNKC